MHAPESMRWCMKSVTQSVGSLYCVSGCRHACLELSGPVQMTARSQELLFTLEFLVTAVCASLSCDCLHLGCPSSVSSPLCACESLVCRGAIESTLLYTCDGRVVLHTPVTAQCALCQGVWKR